MERISKVAGSTPRGVRCVKKHPVSDLVLTAATIKPVKMLGLTVCTLYICTQKSSQDGVGIGISWGNYKKSGIHGFG